MEAPSSNKPKASGIQNRVDHNFQNQYSNSKPPSMALDLNIPPTEDKGDPFGGLPQLHISSNPTPPSIALDLNIPPTEDKGDPFGGLPHGQEHPLLAGAHPIGDAYGAPSLDLNMQAYESG
jgi:hypothetical protein